LEFSRRAAIKILDLAKRRKLGASQHILIHARFPVPLEDGGHQSEEESDKMGRLGFDSAAAGGDGGGTNKEPNRGPRG